MANTEGAKSNLMTLAGITPWQLNFGLPEDRCEYLLKSELWSDCAFVVGETQQEVVLGHKLILAMASPVFGAMFYGTLAETNQQILIPEIRPDAFRAMFEYIYKGEVDICSFYLAWELWYTAKKYELPHLVDKCKKYIISIVEPKNACKAYELACFFEDKCLMDLCIVKIRTNTNDALKDCFEDVGLNTVIAVCSFDPLNVCSELDLFQAVATYANAQQRTQEQSSSTVGVQDSVSKSAMNTDTQTAVEKVVNGWKQNDAQNTPAAVELDSASDATNKKYEPENKKKFLEEKPNIRAAVQKIRFLALTPQQFLEGPARSSLLSEEESHAILKNIISKVGDVPMPAGFSNSRVQRQKIVINLNATTNATTNATNQRIYR